MAKSKIEWTERTWNPLRGCSRISEGCRNCYAERMAARFSKPGEPFANVIHGGKWNDNVELVDSKIHEPLRWRKPSRVFVNSMSDLFHVDVKQRQIDRIFAVMALCPQHTFQVLTKRAHGMFAYLSQAAMCRVCDAADSLAHDRWGAEYAESLPEYALPLSNVWIGVSVEDQRSADQRIPYLLATPAAVRFLSIEPLLGPVDISRWLKPEHWTGGGLDEYGPGAYYHREDCPCSGTGAMPHDLHWVIVGGESGPRARPMHPDWARSIRDQCQEAGVPFFFKQWGGVRKGAAGRLLDGREWSEYPEVPYA